MIVNCGMHKNMRIQHPTSPFTATKQIFIKIYKHLCDCKRHKEEKGAHIQSIQCMEKNIVMIYMIQNKISTETTRYECDVVFQNIKENKVTMDNTT